MLVWSLRTDVKKLPASFGFSTDKRRARRQHRVAARHILANGTLLNYPAPRGSVPHSVAMWHLHRARYLGR